MPLFVLVRGTGVEPASPYGRYHLKVVRLPVSPPAHVNYQPMIANNIKKFNKNPPRMCGGMVLLLGAARNDYEVMELPEPGNGIIQNEEIDPELLFLFDGHHRDAELTLRFEEHDR